MGSPPIPVVAEVAVRRGQGQEYIYWEKGAGHATHGQFNSEKQRGLTEMLIGPHLFLSTSPPSLQGCEVCLDDNSRQPRGWPSVVAAHVESPIPECGLDLMTPSEWMTEAMGCYLCGEFITRLWLPSWGPFCLTASWITCPGGSQLPCCGAALCKGIHGKGTKASKSHMRELGSPSTPVKPLLDTAAPVW